MAARLSSGAAGSLPPPSSAITPASSSSPAPSASSPGPIVQRRIQPHTSSALRQAGATAGAQTAAPSTPTGQGRGSVGSGRDSLKPTIRRTIESIVSTGSQADYFKPEQTIILFDWDDTLCPSNWIRENRPALSFFKPAPLDEKFQRPLQELQKHVEATLKLALKMGKVVIVTNAMDPWVETSCRNFLPQLVPIVSTIPVIYARSIYESVGLDRVRQQAQQPQPPAGRGVGVAPKAAAMPGMYAANGQNKLASHNARLAMQVDPQRWKEVAFEQEIGSFYNRYQHQSWKNVISIGDSIFERDAVRRVVCNRANSKKQCRTKTAKLLDEPEVDELIAQVKVIHDALCLMVQHDGNLDIEIDEEDLKLDLSLAEKIMDR